jgi:hypothetical protein
MQTANLKDEARRLVDQLPEDATWEDLMYEIYVRQKIEAGLKASDEDRALDVEEVRKRFGLEP